MLQFRGCIRNYRCNRKKNVKEVIKKQLENASKRKGGEKTQMMQMIPADTDVFKTSSDRLKKVMTSYDQTRRLHDV